MVERLRALFLFLFCLSSHHQLLFLLAAPAHALHMLASVWLLLLRLRALIDGASCCGLQFNGLSPSDRNWSDIHLVGVAVCEMLRGVAALKMQQHKTPLGYSASVAAAVVVPWQGGTLCLMCQRCVDNNVL